VRVGAVHASQNVSTTSAPWGGEAGDTVGSQSPQAVVRNKGRPNSASMTSRDIRSSAITCRHTTRAIAATAG
jgi:hypothetical protein